MARLGGGWMIVSSLCLASCGDNASPEQKCDQIVSVECNKIFSCGAGAPLYTSESDCENKERVQFGCAQWTLPAGCSVDWSAFDRCLGDWSALSCSAAASGQSPASCQNAAGPPVCPGGAIACSNSTSTSSGTGCLESRSGCSDGHAYAVTCQGTVCICQVDGLTTMTLPSGSSCNHAAFTACGWNLS